MKVNWHKPPTFMVFIPLWQICTGSSVMSPTNRRAARTTTTSHRRYSQTTPQPPSFPNTALLSGLMGHSLPSLRKRFKEGRILGIFKAYGNVRGQGGVHF